MWWEKNYFVVSIYISLSNNEVEIIYIFIDYVILILYKELNIQQVLNFTYSCLSVLLYPQLFKEDMWLTFRQNQSGIVYPPSNMLQPSGTVVDCKHGSHIRQESLKWQRAFKELCSTMWWKTINRRDYSFDLRCQIENRDKTKWYFLHSLWYLGTIYNMPEHLRARHSIQDTADSLC